MNAARVPSSMAAGMRHSRLLARDMHRLRHATLPVVGADIPGRRHLPSYVV